MNSGRKNFWLGAGAKPIAGRFSAGLWVFALLVIGPGFGPTSAGAQTSTLTESEAVERALAAEGIQAGWNAEVEVLEARSRAARRWPNPVVSYSREQTYADTQDVAEDFILLEQALPIGGRRRLLAQSLQIRATARSRQNRAEARDLAAEVREAFYRVLHAQRRSEVHARWLDRMRELEETFKKRVDAGETAPYELDRLQVEISRVESELDVEKAELANQRARLAGLLGEARTGESLEVTGTLLPGSLPTDAEFEEALANRPTLRASQRRVEAAERQLKAAKRLWVPEPTLTGGYKRSASGGRTDHGFVAGISLNLPLADRGAAEADAVRSTKVRAETRATIQRRRLSAKYMGLLQKARLLREAARNFEDQGLAAAKAVYETARKSYRAGEAGILELVDAYRRRIDARLHNLKLANLTRQAEVALELAPPQRQGSTDDPR